MKKRKYLLLGALSTVASVGTILTTVSCSQDVEAENKVAVVVSNEKVTETITREMEYSGLDTVGKSSGSQEDQNSGIDSAVEHNALALLISPLNDKVVEAVKRASIKSIPVIAFEHIIEAETTNYNGFVTYDKQSTDKSLLAKVAAAVVRIIVAQKGNNPSAIHMREALMSLNFGQEISIEEKSKKYKIGNKYIKTVVVRTPESTR